MLFEDPSSLYKLFRLWTLSGIRLHGSL